jgi:hypothetical protein
VLDHVVLVVKDLDAASAGFRARGFRLKPGRLHPNNLLNRHIKFGDGSSLELMMVQGAPRDAMARDYADLVARAEGGVYVALRVQDLNAAMKAADDVGLSPRESASGSWRFLSFPSTSPAAALFFSTGGASVQDPDSLLDHAPRVEGLAEVWLEGGSEVVELLESLGAQRCGRVRAADGRTGERLALGRGRLVVLPREATARPRVAGVVLKLSEPAPSTTVYPHPSFCVRYAFRLPTLETP